MPCNIEVMREILDTMSTREVIRFMNNIGLGWYPFSGDYIDQMRDAENTVIEYLSNETDFGFYAPYKYDFQSESYYVWSAWE